MKNRLVTDFADTISFSKSHQGNMPEVVISTDMLTSTSFHHEPELTVQKAAYILRNATVEKFKDVTQPNWPPTAEELDDDQFKPPPILESFIKTLLTSSERKSRSNNVDRISDSFAEDITYNCCQGKVMLSKQFLLALGLHNLTGSRLQFCV